MIHKNKVDISDLSYSGLSNQIQGDERIAAEILDCCADVLSITRAQIKKYQEELAHLLLHEKMLLDAGINVAQHLKKELPMAVITDKYIIVLTERDLTIERNVIVAL